MRVRVFVLRRSGRRFHDRDQESIDGELRLDSTMSGHTMHRVAKLSAVAVGSRSAELLPPLYEPELVAIGDSALLLRGFESAGGVGYVQEWRCEMERA
jgi:hypothetical protein